MGSVRFTETEPQSVIHNERVDTGVQVEECHVSMEQMYGLLDSYLEAVRRSFVNAEAAADILVRPVDCLIFLLPMRPIHL